MNNTCKAHCARLHVVCANTTSFPETENSYATEQPQISWKFGEGIGDGFWACRGLHLLTRTTSHQFGGSDECQAFVIGLSTVQPQRRQGSSTGQEESIMWYRETQEAGLSLDLYTRQSLPQECPCITSLRWFGIDMLSWSGTRFWLITLILSKLTPSKKTCESNKPF